MSNYPRARIGAALIVAFVCGLVFASGFDLTRFGWAQTHVTPVANIVGGGSHSAGPIGDINNGFEAVVDKVKPAVVSIHVETYAQEHTGRRGNGGGGGNQEIPPQLQDFFKQFGGGSGGGADAEPPSDEPMEGAGSGFIVSKDGYILTNNHVVEDVDKVTVSLVDRRVFEAKVIGRDPTTDVAVIKIDATDLPTVTMGDDAQAHVGQWALAIGNPLDLDFTVTAGIVSAKGRSVQLPGRTQYQIEDYIQTDAAINPGNSGGPLVNARGEVIGINSAIESATGYAIGYGFAIPITLAEEVMNDLIKYGKVRRAVIGVQILPVTPEDAQAAGLKSIGGAKVAAFSPDPDNSSSSPAGRAGIKPGDIIISAAGKPVDQQSTLQRIIRGFAPGQSVDVQVMRFGQEKTFHITLDEQRSDTSVVAERPAAKRGGDAPAPTAKSYDRLGITVAPATAEAQLFETHNGMAMPASVRSGLSVTAVSQRGPNSHTVGENWVITKEMYPTERDIKTSADLEQALAAVKAGGVIEFMMAIPPNQGSPTWTTSPVTLRVQ